METLVILNAELDSAFFAAEESAVKITERISQAINGLTDHQLWVEAVAWRAARADRQAMLPAGDRPAHSKNTYRFWQRLSAVAETLKFSPFHLRKVEGGFEVFRGAWRAPRKTNTNTSAGVAGADVAGAVPAWEWCADDPARRARVVRENPNQIISTLKAEIIRLGRLVEELDKENKTLLAAIAASKASKARKTAKAV